MELGQKGDPGAVEHCHQALEQVTWKPERTQELLTQAGLGGIAKTSLGHKEHDIEGYTG